MAATQEELQRLNADLDEALIAYFDLFTEYQTLFAELGNRLKNGWWELGRARYAMGAGVNTVSQQLFPANMTATARYLPSEEGSATEETHSSSGVSKDGAGAQLHKRAKGTPKDDNKAGAGEKKESSGKKKKKKESGKEHATDESSAKVESGETTEAKSDAGRERWKDPINWFGLLPPSNLRVAQTEFKSAVEVVCSLTTIKRMLQAKQDDYNELLQKKKQLTVHS